MAQTNDPNSMIGDFKNLYKSMGLVDAIPQWCLVQDRFKYEEADSGTGQYFVFGVVLQRENAATYAPSSGVSSGAQTLATPVAGYIGQAQVEGYAIYMRAQLAYDAAAKASKAGKKAFAQAYGAVLKNLKESHQYRLELSLLTGQDGLGVVSTNTAGVLVITAASWGTGVWATGLKGAILEAFTTVAASATQHNGDLTISSVDVAAKSVTVTGTNAAVVPGDILYFKSARTTTGWNECPGIRKILTNTGSLFNIDASTQELWKASSYAVGGNLSLTAIMQAAAQGLNFGLEKGLLFVAPEKFAQLASDEAALRRYVRQEDNVKRGVKGIVFLMGGVEIEILPHPLMRQGEAYLLSEETFHRVGATDVTMALPGSDEPLTVQVSNSSAIEIRSMSDQGIYSEKPAQSVIMTGIT